MLNVPFSVEIIRPDLALAIKDEEEAEYTLLSDEQILLFMKGMREKDKKQFNEMQKAFVLYNLVEEKNVMSLKENGNYKFLKELEKNDKDYFEFLKKGMHLIEKEENGKI